MVLTFFDSNSDSRCSAVSRFRSATILTGASWGNSTYFHGDDGRGLGANHQTGSTGLVAKLLEQSGE